MLWSVHRAAALLSDTDLDTLRRARGLRGAALEHQHGHPPQLDQSWPPRSQGSEARFQSAQGSSTRSRRSSGTGASARRADRRVCVVFLPRGPRGLADRVRRASEPRRRRLRRSPERAQQALPSEAHPDRATDAAALGAVVPGRSHLRQSPGAAVEVACSRARAAISTPDDATHRSNRSCCRSRTPDRRTQADVGTRHAGSCHRRSRSNAAVKSQYSVGPHGPARPPHGAGDATAIVALDLATEARIDGSRRQPGESVGSVAGHIGRTARVVDARVVDDVVEATPPSSHIAVDGRAHVGRPPRRPREVYRVAAGREHGAMGVKRAAQESRAK